MNAVERCEGAVPGRSRCCGCDCDCWARLLGSTCTLRPPLSSPVKPPWLLTPSPRRRGCAVPGRTLPNRPLLCGCDCGCGCCCCCCCCCCCPVSAASTGMPLHGRRIEALLGRAPRMACARWRAAVSVAIASRPAGCPVSRFTHVGPPRCAPRSRKCGGDVAPLGRVVRLVGDEGDAAAAAAAAAAAGGGSDVPLRPGPEGG